MAEMPLHIQFITINGIAWQTLLTCCTHSHTHCICLVNLYFVCCQNFAHLSYSLSYTLSLLPPSFLFKFPPFLAFDSSSIRREFLLLLIGLELVVEILWTGVESLLWVEVGVELVEESAALKNSQDEESTWMTIIVMAIHT